MESNKVTESTPDKFEYILAHQALQLTTARAQISPPPERPLHVSYTENWCSKILPNDYTYHT